jgi:hypothetical protein
MPLSIWEYLRERARDAVLAGIQDAMDIAEQGDTNGSQHTRAIEFASRLTPDAKQLPSASMNGTASSDPARSSTTNKTHTRPAEASSFDDEFERRLDSVGRQSGPQDRETPPQTTRRKRGRPPKSEGR